MATYNGHKNWNHWNVSLWIGGDEGLYRLAKRLLQRNTVPKAAELMLSELEEMGMDKTPDGAPYSKTTIMAAMRGL